MTSATPRYTWERHLLERSSPEGMSTAAQHVALVLATFAKQDGTGIEPSVARLMTITSRSRRGVQEALRELRESGWIKQTRAGHNMATKPLGGVIKPGTDAGAQRRNVTSAYVLTVPGAQPSAP